MTKRVVLAVHTIAMLALGALAPSVWKHIRPTGEGEKRSSRDSVVDAERSVRIGSERERIISKIRLELQSSLRKRKSPLLAELLSLVRYETMSKIEAYEMIHQVSPEELQLFLIAIELCLTDLDGILEKHPEIHPAK